MSRFAFIVCIFRKRLRQNAGYTVVEVLVAMALMTAVLLPTTQWFARTLISSESRALIVATQLAQAEMERALLDPSIVFDERTFHINNKKWLVRCRSLDSGGLRKMQVRVFTKDASTALVELAVLRTMD